MTTVAYKGGIIAADRAISSNGHVGTTKKIWKRKSDGALVGCCGLVALFQRWSEWFLAGERGPPPSLGTCDDSDTTALVVRPSGLVEVWCRFGPAKYDAKYHAIGSGGDLAMGAMAVGASARVAVAAAAKHDHATGHGITFLKLG